MNGFGLDFVLVATVVVVMTAVLVASDVAFVMICVIASNLPVVVLDWSVIGIKVLVGVKVVVLAVVDSVDCVGFRSTVVLAMVVAGNSVEVVVPSASFVLSSNYIQKKR